MAKEIQKAASEDDVASVNGAFPVDPGYQAKLLPRFGMVSQDVTEGKGKQMKVVTEAGTFFTEKPSDEKDEETGKMKWDREELGDTVEGVIIYQRKQLSMYDESTDTFTSSPVYDTDEEIIPLWANKAEVDRGTAPELQAKYMGVNRNGKPQSDLKVKRILYVLIEGELYQTTLGGSSMFSYLGYTRTARPGVPSVMTQFTSTHEQNGNVEWNKMQFEAMRPLTAAEIAIVKEKQSEIIEDINGRKAQFSASAKANAEFDAHLGHAALGDGK